VSWANTYGVRKDAPEEYLKKTLRETYLQADRVRNPSDYLHLADTTSQAQQGFTAYQYHIFYYQHASLKLAHARHNHQLNGLFLDWHVESCPQARLNELGVNALFGPDMVRGYFE
jgi:prepilin-type processing-associated H-X9-DG protein